MITRAVTSDASAASPFESSTHPHAEFLPTDKEYRMTGNLPDADTETEDTSKAETDKESVDATPAHEDERGDDKSAAASEAATTQNERKEEKPKKTAATSESRWQRLSRENKELRERVNRAESANNSSRETSQESRPAAETKTEAKTETEDKAAANLKPKIDDVDAKTGKPKFASYEDYLDAREEWNRKEALREFNETSQQSAKEREAAEAEKLIQKTVGERVQKTRANYPDYDDVLKSALAVKNEHGQDALFYTKGSHIEGFLFDSDRGPEVLYEIAKNFDDHQHIFARDAQGRYLMNPVRQVRELARIELSLESAKAKAVADDGSDEAAAKNSGKTSSSTSSVKPVTQAFRPPNQTSGKGTVTKDAVEQAAEEGDFETYAREQNARELARRKKGK